MAAENDPQSLTREIASRGAREGAEILASKDDATTLAVLRASSPETARKLVSEIRGKRRRKLLAAASPEEAMAWAPNGAWADGTIGRMMEPATAIFSPDVTVGEAVESIRELVKHTFVTYGFVVDAQRHLVGIVTMRDLLFNDRATKLSDVMLRDVFFLNADLQLRDAMRLVLDRHFPVYPVCLAGPDARRRDPRTGDVRGAGDRDQRPARVDGRRRQGGEALHAVAPQPEVPASLAPVEPPDRLSGGGRRRSLPGDDRPRRDPRRLPARARGAVRQHGVSGARGRAARAHARRACSRQGEACCSPRKRCSAS